MAALNRVGRFFPLHAVAPAPATNGNGKHVVPATEQKALRSTLTIGEFHPINGAGDVALAASGAGWYAASWLAYACMRYRATKLIEPPLWVSDEKDGEEAWVEGAHPIEDLLQRPNPDMTLSDILELTSLYLDSTPGCVWHKVRDNGNRPVRLYPYSGDDFQVEAATVEGVPRIFGRYRLRTARGWGEWIGPEDVIHFRNANPASIRSSLPPLDAALARLGVESELIRAIRHGLANSIRPSANVAFPADFNPGAEQLAEYVANVSAQHAGARRTGGLFVTGGGAEYTPLPLGFAGLEGGELSKEVESAVCAVFQVPPAIVGAYVGLENSSDRHNMETAVAMFYDNMVLPTWSRWEDTLTVSLLRDFDSDSRRFLRFDKARVRGLKTDQTKQAEVIAKAGRALTVDDARVMLGLQPLGDERGEQLMSVGLNPSDVPEPPKALPSRVETKAVDPSAVRWMVFDAAARGQEFGWETAAADQLAEDRDAVLALFDAAKNATGPTERKDDDPADAAFVRDLVGRVAEHLDMSAKARWEERVRPLTLATARAAVERAAAELNISFDLLQPGLIRYVEKHAATLVTQVTDTTKQAVRDALAAGLVEGESIPKLRDRIRDSGAFSRSRAELIARTETTANANGAAVRSLQEYSRETGDRFQKRWLSARDARVRDEHRELDGETVGLDEAFSNGLTHPSEPNCRCTTLLTMEAA